MEHDKQKRLLQFIIKLDQSYAKKAWVKVKFFRLLEWIILKSNLFFCKEVEKEKCDILFIHTYEGEPERLNSLLSILKIQNLKIAHEYFKIHRAISERKLIKTRAYKNPILGLYSSFVEYLVIKYDPKIVVTLENSLPISPIIKERINGIYINIGHGVVPTHFYHSMTDFHYFFVFGKSSIRNLENNKSRFGSTKVLATGSPFINYKPKEEMLSINSVRTVLYFSSWIPDGEFGKILVEVVKLVIKWAQKRKDIKLFIKVHPLEDPAFVSSLIGDAKNIIILEKSVKMEDALKDIDLVLNQWSNASIEASLLNIPTLIVNPSNIPDDYLYLEEYFPKRAKTIEEIDERLEVINKNYRFYQNKAREFYSFHLETVSGCETIADNIFTLLKKGELENVTELKDNFRF